VSETDNATFGPLDAYGCEHDRDFTFVCPTEILAFNDALSEFEKLNTVVYGTIYARRKCSER